MIAPHITDARNNGTGTIIQARRCCETRKATGSLTSSAADRQPDLSCGRPQNCNDDGRGRSFWQSGDGRQQTNARGQISRDKESCKPPQSPPIEADKLTLAARETPEFAETAIDRVRRPNGAPR
jgi:hypothetical protein